MPLFKWFANFLRLPTKYSGDEVIECERCEVSGRKRDMVFHDFYGWYCSDDHFLKDWKDNQGA
jgi:hypothetical protein